MVILCFSVVRSCLVALAFGRAVAPLALQRKRLLAGNELAFLEGYVGAFALNCDNATAANASSAPGSLFSLRSDLLSPPRPKRELKADVALLNIDNIDSICSLDKKRDAINDTTRTNTTTPPAIIVINKPSEMGGVGGGGSDGAGA